MRFTTCLSDMPDYRYLSMPEKKKRLKLYGTFEAAYVALKSLYFSAYKLALFRTLIQAHLITKPGFLTLADNRLDFPFSSVVQSIRGPLLLYV